METDEISERYITPCFVNGLEAYDVGEELPLFICKMGKSNRNKKRTMENFNLLYQDIGPSSLAGSHLTQEEVEKEALAVRISQNFALFEEERLRDKVELDGKTVKEEEDATKRIKGEALKEKDDPGAFIFPIRTVESDSDDEEEYVIKRNRCAGDELQSKKIIRFRLGGQAHNLTLLEFARRLGLYQVTELEGEGFNVYFEGGLRTWVITKWMKRKGAGTHKESQICCDLDATTLRDLIESDGKLIPEDPQLGMPRVGIPRPLRASM
nr:hypothetical protein [Tanacetum cinerariifolium]